MLFLAEEVETAGEILGGAGQTIAIGLVVVFSALIALTFIFWLFGKIAGTDRKETPAKENTPFSPMPAPTKASPAVKKPVPAPQVQAGIREEVVAAISAAVMAMAPEGKQYVIRSVSRARGERPVWAAAGLAESTRPF